MDVVGCHGGGTGFIDSQNKKNLYHSSVDDRVKGFTKSRCYVLYELYSTGFNAYSLT